MAGDVFPSRIKFAREVVQTKKVPRAAIAKQMSGLGVDEDMVEDSMKKLGLDPADIGRWSEDDILRLAVDFRKKTKPMIIACNKIDVPGGKENFERLKKMFPGYIMIPCSAESELALREAAKHDIIRYVPGQPSFDILKPAMRIAFMNPALSRSTSSLSSIRTS